MDVTNFKLRKSSKHSLNAVHACLVWTTFQYFSYASIVVTVLRVVKRGMFLEYFVYFLKFGVVFSELLSQRGISVVVCVISKFLAKSIACLIQPCTAVPVILSQDS